MAEDVNEVESIEECVELATVDAYGPEEVASGWLNCLQEIFEDGITVKVLGVEVSLEDFDLAGDVIVVAVCKKGKKKARVTLDSLMLVDPSAAQALWIEAYLKSPGGE